MNTVMISLKTEVKTKQFGTIDYSKKMFFMGSCFSDSIGDKFKRLKFNTQINPFGVVFNPVSIRKLLSNILAKKTDLSGVVEQQNLFVSLYHHSKLYSSDEASFKKDLQFLTEQMNRFLKRTDFLFITLGTSYVYRYLDNNSIVANCHKLPKESFDKEFISVDNEVVEYKKLIHLLKEFNPKLNVVFTVSPVRHIKDGVVENNQSKGALHLLIKELTKLDGVSYFPSYEIVMDELRDYRFYKEDLLHPSDIAVDVIFERLCNKNVNNETFETMKRIESLIKMSEHKPLRVENYSSFAQDCLQKIEIFEKENPAFCFHDEKQRIRNLL